MLDSTPNRCSTQRAGADRLIGDLAERQYGVVGRRQLLDAGISRRAIERRVESGRLLPLQRGVYAVGHRELRLEGKWMAAVLAAGPGAVLSHRSAAALWKLRRSEHVEVTVPSDRRRHGIRVHRGRIPEDERTTECFIPVTTVPRTLFDLAAVTPQSQVERALKEAEMQRLGDRLSLPDLLARHPRGRGARTIKKILEHRTPLTRSELEVRFLAFIERFDLQAPEMNRALFVDGRWFECDCLWREERVIVELDGFAVHGTFAAFQDDRSRDRILQAHGWRVIRATWAQLRDEPAALARDLTALLSMFPGHATRHV